MKFLCLATVGAKQVLRAILESAGAEVDTVSSGAEVLSALAAHLADVLIAHVGMPGFEIHLAKPVDPAELVASVATLARRRRR